MPTQDQISPGFGANEWMVEEMRAAWSADPSSVSPQWRELFETDPGAGLHQPGPASSNGSASSAAGGPRRATITPQSASTLRRPSAVQDVTRSDLPPAPPSDTAPPTSPYAQRQAVHPAHDQDGDAYEDRATRLKGAAARTAKNMDDSLSMPTATSARAVPAKVLIENRAVINSHLARTRGGKVSFTHLIGWAVVESLTEMPSMNVSYGVDEAGKPVLHEPAHVAFGLAIDVPGSDGQRRLLVPSIKQADLMDLSQFVEAYEALVAKARENKLDLDDFRGTTVTLTNPGMIGTLHSVPRLMPGQGLIVGVGAMDYPAAFAGASPDTLARQAIGKVVTLTSTYDHRVIQGAASGEFLRLVERKLLGLDGFWNRAFESLRIPLEPVKWVRDTTYDPELETGKPARVAELIHAYRQRGHLAADNDPLTYRLRRHPDLDITSYGLSLWDLDRSFPTRGLGGRDRATLREILRMLRDAYCRTVGVEYMHIQDPAQRAWWQERLERDWEDIADEERRRILTKLEQAEAFETFLQTKYVGQKRFSLEGGESLIVALDRLLDAAAHDGLDEVVIGMAHRGRLNVLTNIAGKSYGQVFDEFEGNGVIEGAGTGDVKYHLGTVGVFSGTDGVSTRVSLAANPSHLETVDGVVEGIVRAKQDRIGLGEKGYTVMPVLVHGDAAFAGQGVVYETLNMSQLPAYRTGGTVHIVVNNQIGFTTGSASARSTIYATDLAKGLQVPIFHVNADDPETVARTARHAYEYRRTFHKDVIIDLICYRRRGHNEGDDPSMTQPLMYRLIDSLDSTRGVYTAALVGRGDITPQEAQEIAKSYQDELERVFTEARIQVTGGTGSDGADEATDTSAQDLSDPTKVGVPLSSLEIPHSQRAGTGMMLGWTSAVPRDVVERIGDAQVAWPESFTVHPKLQAMLAKRREATRKGGIDWGLGELIALGSLLMEGVPIRLAGEDARRATFAQRHAVLHDHTSGQEWTPLSFLTPDQAPLEIYDSLLSEYAALAFEYGYSVERPEGLTMWEAQFGDFANGAQSVIDEYVTSAAQKWGQRSGLVMLLPHGQEGQGPDHSSARIERYLQMCAQDNMLVAQPSTPASYFHLLREHTYTRPRRPLIVFTPKQLLRLKAACSPVEDFTSGTFQPVIGETDDAVLASARKQGVDRVLLCSGRVYYDLLAHRTKTGDTSTAIVRLEQLYPLESSAIAEALAPFSGAELVWVQDEPANQGMWPYLALNLPTDLTGGVLPTLVSRPEAAAPAVGTAGVHRAQQEEILRQAFARH
ncbi:multifunctional oxoglutarate decarboxylase/oxoglutarate dehydrogenase thiamine pyrophosphate-binding subunit/dihydrolipoyllysine-residue succinyltransferase subunit [Actinomyces sp. oral taxon 169]|uniref:multifunctional oxoglutarate decarboxylase/oxoglutarate dehydrogenase thiamine pyrophosphate-binding subunit/dihydrolipoyllysine-residue succinyltransferase subunit n=1 Tax=Actinomyces sp. oral taxon 169 TaxID=712116 RepID=UPI0015FE9E89|nr:multifunctional oxoglutarate decarboxylase/oxoglutarate dehydrogenase thiamine pyrophosphate-binding subunit/dihydrolipoyllysine-residue succinyltransferase subunit [Actinomyces sp. oral taxon 169]QLF53970.1 multifunctional oxoglutarate decarboxylase/oxoglutarate dehydrogenase thiamine pyrophosphate-binding subunit/dihydrolipoyllysine-residue succinyltransferase subunit [Actinomyces sp. oral taxon 169]